MKSIEKLREYAPNHAELYAVCNAAADEIEAEIAERYMELPLDADGVPIRVGDELVVPNYSKCVLIACYVGHSTWVDTSFEQHNAVSTIHAKPHTMEDVLESFIEDYDHWDEFAHFERGESRNKLFAKYADEIRKAVGE